MFKLIMDSIPPRLRGELSTQMHIEALKNVDLFANCM